MNEYHDNEWGVPIFEENHVFEMFALDCFQAGLSWITILNKREAFRKAFDNFNVAKVAAFDQKKIDKLLLDPGIIRNKLKIPAVINNARIILQMRNEFNSFGDYIWSFSKGKTIQNRWKSLADIPATSPVSDAMSKDMIIRGFKFAGSTICYAFMQSIGMVNDHVITCYRHKELFR
jgi:DNA-3-methyladenine glycosylase I